MRYNWQNDLGANKQVAPRFAFAYGPGKSHKMVFRGGAGIFFDRTGAGPLGDLLLYNGVRLQSILITDPSYPNPLSGLGAVGAQPSDVVRFDPTIREPYTIEYSLGMERQLAKKTTLAIMYNGSRAVSLFRSRDINAPLGPDYLARPDPAFGQVRQIESSGRQSGNSILFTLRGDVTRFFTGLAQYTVSWTNNNTGGINWFPADQYDLSGEWARADFDQRQRLNVLESFNPGKWFALGIGVTLATGKPYTETTGEDSFHTGLDNARPPGISRNSKVGPPYATVDLRWSRDFNLSKVKKEKGPVTTVAIDAFNLLNEVNYVSYVGDQSSPFFGKAVAALPTRRLQATVRLKF
jgi:hypothetical protein